MQENQVNSNEMKKIYFCELCLPMKFKKRTPSKYRSKHVKIKVLCEKKNKKESTECVKYQLKNLDHC